MQIQLCLLGILLTRVSFETGLKISKLLHLIKVLQAFEVDACFGGISPSRPPPPPPANNGGNDIECYSMCKNTSNGTLL